MALNKRTRKTSSSAQAQTANKWNQRRSLHLEKLEDRVAPAVTAGNGPGGFLATGPTSDMVLWTRAESLGLVDGADVDAWADESGRGNDLGDRSGPVTYVASQSNNQPSVHFGDVNSGTLGFLRTSQLLPNGSDGEMFVVVQSPDGEDGQADGGFHRTGTNSNQHYTWNNRFIYENFATNSRTNNIASPDHDLTEVHVYNVSGVNAGPWALRLDGDVLASKNSTGTSGYHGEWWFGRGSSGNEWDGHLSEIIVLERVLNSAERQILTNHLHTKYAPPHALNGDVFEGDTAGNGEHDLDLFGVGQVSGENVVDAGAAGFGIEAGSLNDGDFILAAHDGGTGKTTAGIPAGLEFRWNRTWYVDVTNASAPATLTFDYSDAGLTLTNESSFTLLHSTDGVNWNAVPGQNHIAPSPNINGDTITFTNVNLNDGWYTLGDASILPLVTPTATALSFVEGTNVALDPGLTLDDLDSTQFSDGVVSINSFVNGDPDVLGFTNQLGITGSYDNTTGVLTLTGTTSIANYQTAMRSITYSGGVVAASPRTVTFEVTDADGSPSGNTGSGTRQITIQAAGSPTRFIWDGASDGDGDGTTFTDADNWDRGAVPGANDVLVLQDAGSGVIDLGGQSLAVAGLSLENSVGFTLTNGTVDVGTITTGGTGTVTISAQLNSTNDQTLTSGELVLTNFNNNLTGTWTVEAGGTLTSRIGSDSLGDAPVVLDGGTLNLDVSKSTKQALLHQGFHNTNQDLDSKLTQTPFQDALLTDGPGGRGLDFNSDTDWINTGVIGGRRLDQYTNLFVGTLNASTDPGSYQIRLNARDDQVQIYLDQDGDGLEQSDLVNNNSITTQPFNLTTDIPFAVLQREGGGGSQADVQIQSPSMAGLESIKPSAANQAGLWSVDVLKGTLDNSVTVIADSTINVMTSDTPDYANDTPEATLDSLIIADGVTVAVGGLGELVASTTLQGTGTVDTQAGMKSTLRNITGRNLVADGPGILNLDTFNSYSGTTTVRSGATLRSNADNALGSADGTDATATTVEDGGSIQLLATQTSNELLILNGDGGSVGAIRGEGYTVDWNGPIRLDSASTIRSNVNNFRIFGQIDTNGNALELDADNQIVI